MTVSAVVHFLKSCSSKIIDFLFPQGVYMAKVFVWEWHNGHIFLAVKDWSMLQWYPWGFSLTKLFQLRKDACQSETWTYTTFSSHDSFFISFSHAPSVMQAWHRLKKKAWKAKRNCLFVWVSHVWSKKKRPLTVKNTTAYYYMCGQTLFLPKVGSWAAWKRSGDG